MEAARIRNKAKRASEEARLSEGVARLYVCTIFGVMKKINSGICTDFEQTSVTPAAQNNACGITPLHNNGRCCPTAKTLEGCGSNCAVNRNTASDGYQAYAGLVQASDGNFYGTTYAGGANSDGTVFKITSAGTLTVLHSFATSDGYHSYSRLVQGTDGNLYGTAFAGGVNSDGTVFKVTTAGTLTVVHSFAVSDGYQPYGGVVQGTDKNFYGTTCSGGSNSEGTIFKLALGL
jgi:uncharacterized repeat protein (TIGR03803 family)